MYPLFAEAAIPEADADQVTGDLKDIGEVITVFGADELIKISGLYLVGANDDVNGHI